MNKLLLSIAVAFALVPLVCAAPMCANPVTVTTYPNGTAFSASLFPPDCAFGGQLLFSAFGVSNGSPPSPNVFVNNGGINALGERTLVLNPQLTQPGQDTMLFERISTPSGSPDLFQADLHSIAGSFNFSVSQQVCGAFSLVGSCVGNLGNLLIDNTHANAVAMFQPMQQIFIGKDISIPSDVHVGALTGFQQTFGVPEPVSLFLMGSGLLGLGLAGRRTGKR